jgi:hypothetical protein
LLGLDSNEIFNFISATNVIGDNNGNDGGNVFTLPPSLEQIEIFISSVLMASEDDITALRNEIDNTIVKIRLADSFNFIADDSDDLAKCEIRFVVNFDEVPSRQSSPLSTTVQDKVSKARPPSAFSSSSIDLLPTSSSSSLPLNRRIIRIALDDIASDIADIRVSMKYRPLSYCANLPIGNSSKRFVEYL